MCGHQVLGGLAAGITYTTLTGVAVPLKPGKGFGFGEAAFAEIFYTSARMDIFRECNRTLEKSK